MLLRHHNEAESLHAVQKLDWEWKMKELAMCDMKSSPVIDDIFVPMVHVSDDFDLLPAWRRRQFKNYLQNLENKLKWWIAWLNSMPNLSQVYPVTRNMWWNICVCNHYEWSQICCVYSTRGQIIHTFGWIFFFLVCLCLWRFLHANAGLISWKRFFFLIIRMNCTIYII